ncbi:uncharacterized protein CLUP02_07975 [Colletotrichum lupini]|uniref:Uncharacterized protein n=1 Tax=Colletotrichum lupini TaxID=145971 RepID=A0A9Q8STW6_9PEZI|nr:uncharacterized protein CLUP02_07975 [Colletotrichum lupini]UQC82487.1 hypothetical protein CLUP02_07975 [Colletotrichum lupini]
MPKGPLTKYFAPFRALGFGTLRLEVGRDPVIFPTINLLFSLPDPSRVIAQLPTEYYVADTQMRGDWTKVDSPLQYVSLVEIRLSIYCVSLHIVLASFGKGERNPTPASF